MRELAERLVAPKSLDKEPGLLEAVTRFVAGLYLQGGEQLYHLHTGEIYRDFPAELLKGVSDEKQRTQIFMQWYALRHTPRYIHRWRESSAAVEKYPGVRDLAAAPLFAATTAEKQKMLTQSIAVEFSLGGELQVDLHSPMSSWVRRKSAHGQPYETVEEFVDVLLKQRGTPEYKSTMDKLRNDPDVRRRLGRLDEELRRRL